MNIAPIIKDRSEVEGGCIGEREIVSRIILHIGTFQHVDSYLIINEN